MGLLYKEDDSTFKEYSQGTWVQTVKQDELNNPLEHRTEFTEGGATTLQTGGFANRVLALTCPAGRRIYIDNITLWDSANNALYYLYDETGKILATFYLNNTTPTALTLQTPIVSDANVYLVGSVLGGGMTWNVNYQLIGFYL